MPDVDAKALHLRVAANSFSENLRVEATAFSKGKEIGGVTGLANTELVLNLPDPHLWSPDDPFLYDLTSDFERRRSKYGFRFELFRHEKNRLAQG